MALIVERQLCMQCISMKSGLSSADVDAALEKIRHVMVVTSVADGRCRSCGIQGQVVSVDRTPL